nr:hypothetical protein [Tanacetum cinerariifolium]
MLMKRIGELEHIMANLIQDSKQLEQRLDIHGAHLYTLEHLDIPHQVSKAVEESILSSDVPVPKNNWASALASTYSPPPEDSLLAKPLPLGGPPDQVTIQSDFFFNKDLEYLRYGSKGSKPALSILKMKAAYYLDVGLKQLVPDQMWIEKEYKYDIAAMYGISHWWFQRQQFYIDKHTSKGDRRAVRTHMQILSVVRIKVFSMYGYDYMKKIVLRRADLNEHVIAERDFKYLYPSDFEDPYLLNLQEDFQLGIESYQTQLNLTKPRWDATDFEYKHDYTIDEALGYLVKEFKINRMNLVLNTRKDLVRGLPRLKFEKDHLVEDLEAPRDHEAPNGPAGGGGRDLLRVLQSDYGSSTSPELHIAACDLHEFCKSRIPTYVGEGSLSCQLLKTTPMTPQQNEVVERRNRTLVEAARTILIFSKAPMFLWAKTVATACYTQNRSLIHTRHNKTPYELVHNKNPDLTFFRVFGALCYPTNDNEDLEKLQPTADIGIFVGYAPSRKGARSKFSSYNSLCTPTNKDLEILFQPMFDEYMEPPCVERPVSPAQVVQASVNSAGTPSSTTIYQDAPSPSISQSSSALQSQQAVAAELTFMRNNLVAPIDNTPFINVFALEPSSDASPFEDISSTESTYVSQTHHHLNK